MRRGSTRLLDVCRGRQQWPQSNSPIPFQAVAPRMAQHQPQQLVRKVQQGQLPAAACHGAACRRAAAADGGGSEWAPAASWACIRLQIERWLLACAASWPQGAAVRAAGWCCASQQPGLSRSSASCRDDGQEGIRPCRGSPLAAGRRSRRCAPCRCSRAGLPFESPARWCASTEATQPSCRVSTEALFRNSVMIWTYAPAWRPLGQQPVLRAAALQVAWLRDVTHVHPLLPHASATHRHARRRCR